MAQETFAVGVDIGGTFTDCVVMSSEGRVETGKVPTTPADRAEGFFASIEEAATGLGVEMPDLLRRCVRLVHGTTTGTNALVTRQGAVTGLLTTAGHKDSLFIMKGGGRSTGLSPDLMLDIVASGSKPRPFVPRSLIEEIEERVDVDGDVVVAMDEDKARAKAAHLLSLGVQSVAISLLWSIKNPVHEHRLREIVSEIDPNIFVSCSSDVASRMGEYERTATCVMNAFIGPLMTHYVDSIQDRAAAMGFEGSVLFAQCAGGAMTTEEARRTPILTVQSGPVAGVVNSVLFSAASGERDIITTDMGGTTFDVAVIRGGEPLAREVTVLDRFEITLPMLDIDSIGAGGGSIAWIDDSGRLNVGPQSAGADPGPACYGRGGTSATVTDADVLLGFVDPDQFLHGTFPIDIGLAEKALRAVGQRVGLDPFETAAGINRLVDSNMADLIRRMVEYRGMDPRKFALLAFGGGGAVHAASCAAAAGVRRVIVAQPKIAPVWSAGGAANADIVHMMARPLTLELPVEPDTLEAGLVSLEEQARARLAGEGFASGQMVVQRVARMKHKMQIFDLEVPVDFPFRTAEDVERLVDRFSAAYEDRFGKNSGYREGGVLVTALHVRATGVTPKHDFLHPARTQSRGSLESSRKVFWDNLGGFADTPVISLSGDAAERLADPLVGPALIQLPNTVAVVPQGWQGQFDQYGNIILEAVGG